MPEKDLIKEQFKKLVSIGDSDWQQFSSHLQAKTFSKRDTITRFGQIENCLYFLAGGIVRYVIHNEQETTSGFAFAGQFFSSYSSFLTRKPGRYEIRPVTHTADCFFLTYDNLQEVYKKTECGEKIGRLAAEQQFLLKSAREASLLTQTPKERYLSLLDEQPEMLHAIPLKYLASYLGITPETLSRIRSSIG